MGKLAITGGVPVQKTPDEKLFHWPIVNDAMRKAQADVLEAGNMSGTDIARRFEAAFAKWQGRKYALSHNNGTNALNAAMYAIGIGPGDEIICTSVTYWASCTGALALGASVVFCDINPETLQMDPASFEARITPRTKAVMVVHYMAHPAPMDEIMAIARKHGLKVIEDVSHAQGGHYKGRMLGTFGDIAAMSLMSCKSFAIGRQRNPSHRGPLLRWLKSFLFPLFTQNRRSRFFTLHSSLFTLHRFLPRGSGRDGGDAQAARCPSIDPRTAADRQRGRYL